MGTTASLIKVAVQENPELLNDYREEYVKLCTEEYSRLSNLGLSKSEIKEEFEASLIRNEPKVLEKIARCQSIEIVAGNEEERGSHFAADCSRAVERMTKKSAHSFLCCVDGSRAAELAVNATLHIRGKHDSVCMFYAYKETVDADKAPGELKKLYSRELHGKVPSQDYFFHFEQRYTRSVMRTLGDFLDHYKDDRKATLLPGGGSAPDFIVMGCAGDMGGRAQFSSLGSTVDLAMRELHIPCIMAKKMCAQQHRRSFVMAVTSSPTSEKGFQTLLQLIRPRDTLRLLHIRQGSDDALQRERSEKTKQYYEKELSLFGPSDSEFISIQVPIEVPVQEAVIEYVNGPQNPDYVAIAPRALKFKSSSPASDHIIRYARANVILCKI